MIHSFQDTIIAKGHHKARVIHIIKANHIVEVIRDINLRVSFHITKGEHRMGFNYIDYTSF